MKLSTLSLTSLLFIPSLAAAAAVPDAPRQNGTLTKRGGEVNYLANCERVDPEADAYDEQYKYSASYMAWYANIDKSQGQQLPDSLSNEYRDWSRGGTTLLWEGSQQNIYFSDSGVSVQTHIDSDAQSRNVGDGQDGSNVHPIGKPSTVTRITFAYFSAGVPPSPMGPPIGLYARRYIIASRALGTRMLVSFLSKSFISLYTVLGNMILVSLSVGMVFWHRQNNPFGASIE